MGQGGGEGKGGAFKTKTFKGLYEAKLDWVEGGGPNDWEPHLLTPTFWASLGGYGYFVEQHIKYIDLCDLPILVIGPFSCLSHVVSNQDINDFLFVGLK